MKSKDRNLRPVAWKATHKWKKVALRLKVEIRSCYIDGSADQVPHAKFDTKLKFFSL